MSKGTNDKLDETLDQKGAQNTETSQSSITGKTSSDSGFYLIMLIIILAAAFYIYQDASKRYAKGISSSDTVQPPADQVLPAEHPQINSGVSEPLTAQPVTAIETEMVIIPDQPEPSALEAAEEEAVKLKDAVSNKVSHMVDKVKNFVSMGGDNAETTHDNVQSEAKTATASVYNIPSNSSVAQPQQGNMTVPTDKQTMNVSSAQPDVNAESIIKSGEESAAGLKEQANETDQTGVGQMNNEVQSASMNTQPPMPSQYDSGSRGFQGYQPPPSYNARPGAYQGGYNSYQARNQYRQPGYVPNPYSQPGPQYQPDPYYQPEPQYRPNQNRYDNSYYDQGYGYPYPDYPQYRQGPAY